MAAAEKPPVTGTGSVVLDAALTWVDQRFPLISTWKAHLAEYYAPKNFNFWYYFGSLAMLVLVLQIVTGIFLTMNYKPDANLAFASVEYIMREVPGGWIIRYMHSTGASAFFICVYLHMFRSLLYGSHRRPRELLWIFGMLIYLCLMAEAFFGSLALLVLVMQIVTGIFLTMNYKPDSNLAFASVEYIMREVPGGWIIRYMHSTGASAFFVCVYLHMFRALLYGSHRKPRELIWIFGVLIYLLLMGEAFFGYLLPWGQMSYWGAQVIINLFSAIPFIGPDLSLWIRGDYVIADATLNRFFALHVIALPLALLGLVMAHLLALHEVGSNNPDGIEISKHKDANGVPLDGIPFHPYYTVKDILGVVVFLIVFASIVFFTPEMGGYFLEANNFIPADPLKTPPHIAPV